MIFRNETTMPGGGPAREPWIQLRLSREGYNSVARCPCCKVRAHVQLSNTHTASYSIGCDVCQLELSDVEPCRGHALATHRASARRVFDRWNLTFGERA